MSSRTTLAKLSGLIKAKRRETGMGLRDVAKVSGISPSTLSRLERGVSSSLPDTDTLTNLANWLNVPVSSFLGNNKVDKGANEPQLKTPEQIEVYLRADKTLSPQTAEALGKMFNILYQQFTDMQTGNKT